MTCLLFKSDEMETDSVQVQCTPTVSTSQTQYSCSVVTDEYVQTEMSMKNKKNQVRVLKPYQVYLDYINDLHLLKHNVVNILIVHGSSELWVQSINSMDRIG